MSVKSGSRTTTPDYLQTVQTIAHQASSCKDLELPHLLVQLYPIVSSSEISFKDLRKVKEHIWLSDLLHVLVEVLRQDFSTIPGGWDISQQLACILEAVCSGLHPKIDLKLKASEQVNEYYEILLPTAVDSMLILATNVLQAITENSYKNGGCFETIIDSLLSICRSHKPCVQRVTQSPYLLHMLITDSTSLVQVMLIALGKLVNMDKHCLMELSPETLYSILDELVYKMSGSDEKTASLSLEVMASVSSIDSSSMFELIVSRYTELLLIIKKWKFDKHGTNVKHFVDEVEARSIVESEVERKNHAAVLIQASWRGYSSRKKMKRLHNGIRRFQQFYRKWRANKVRLRDKERKVKEICSARLESITQGRMSFWEGQLSHVQQLPPADLSSFIKQQEINAATKIQSRWRAHLAWNKYSLLREGANLSKNATIIQRAFREFSQKKKSSTESDAPHVHRIEGVERENLQQEIAYFRESHKHLSKSETEARNLHDQVQVLLEQFYLSRPTETRKAEQRSIVLSQLERSYNILASAPSLDESFGIEGIDETFSSVSHDIARMAETAHREELKYTNTPWWKRPSFCDT